MIGVSNSYSKFLAIFGFTTFLLSWTGEQSLAVEPDHPGLGAQCRAEVQGLCKGIQPGEGRIQKCIDDNKSKLSAPCRQMIDEKMTSMKEEMQQLKAACEADAKQFCATVEPGKGGVKECLLDHYKEVSDECYGVLETQIPKK